MKILFLLTQLEAGGAQVRVIQTADELRRRGMDVDVAFLYAKRDAFDDVPKIVLSDGSSFVERLRAVFALSMLMRRGRYDALITNTAPSNVIGNLLGRLFRIERQVAWQTQPPERVSKILRLIDRFWGTVGIYDRNVANSHWTHSCFETYPASYRRRLSVIPNGIDFDSGRISKIQARSLLGYTDDRSLVISVGRLSPQKDQATLIRAFRDLRGEPVKLVILGDGELRNDLQALASELEVNGCVEFTGEKDRNVVAQHMAAADLFVFTSRWETFGLAPLEAASASLPIVASDIPVLREVLSTDAGEPAAVFVKPEDAEGFAAAIKRLIHVPSAAAEVSDRGPQVASRYTLERHVDSIESLLTGTG